MLSRRSLLATAASLPVIVPFAARAASLPAETLDDVVAPGVRRSTIILWGDGVEADAPPFTPNRLTADATARQFGWDALVLGVMAQPQGEDGVARAMLVVAHPAAQPRMLPPDANTPSVLSGLQGASVLNLERHDGRWLVTDGGYQTRRLTGETLCRVTGPALAHLGDATRGIVAPSCGCLTPWGRALIAETPGALATGFVVEFDPADPEAIPAKRSALGRFPRAGILATQTKDGRAVLFMSEDAAPGRLFRFISAAPPSADNPNALDQGSLAVAVLRDNSLRFVPAANAAEGAAGSALDEPAGLALQPDGTILLACRGVRGNAVPSALGNGNPDGRILLLRPQGDGVASDRFSVELALSGGDTGMGAPIVSRPSSLSIDAKGRVWIGADGSGITLAEASFTRLTQIYRQPIGALIGGVAFSPDNSLAFAAVRHPGATAEASFAYPATRWPTLRPDMPPQTTVVGLAVG
jgi:secreted PhoX family phosphatase